MTDLRSRAPRTQLVSDYTAVSSDLVTGKSYNWCVV